MFSKTAVIITNCIGPDFMAKSSQRDLVNACTWMGISKIRRLGIGLLEGVIWDELSEKRRAQIEKRARQAGLKYVNIRPSGRSLKTRTLFMFAKMIHTAVLKTEKTPGADNRHWIQHGWIQYKPAYNA
ncbi:MAG: hypothetical protein FWF29_02875 [Treponema sp.]|nr:hypothetical protein [Treponema sp.]